jgi:mannosyltransferase OCH1-like enzyme
MIQNVLFWIPILLLILFIIVKKKYKQHFENLGENADILEKFLMIMVLTYYFYKGIHIGLIMVMITIIIYIFTPKALEGFDEMKSLTKQLGEIQLGDMVDQTVAQKKIPKRIIQAWKTWSTKKPEMFTLYIESIKNKNPDYEYIFFKDDQIDEFLKSRYPHYYETFQRLPMNIQKMDFFRYVALYHFGGFYFDLDINALEPLDELLNNECVFPIDEIIHKSMCSVKRFNNFCKNRLEFLLGQYGFACSPKNEFIKKLVDGIHHNIDAYVKNYVANSEDYVYITTGPDYVTNMYMTYKNKDNITILHYPKRQYFGKYARHTFAGTWKTSP